MSSVKSKIHANYAKCLDKVAKGGRAPSLKSKYHRSFGARSSRISVPSNLF
ncbi:hypothetical protein [Enterovibrio norvegicus]|uniref:hypothetical protein n=1 Tax=Enterovibrio norvegicus TaxID=188144 RepID=UPI0002DA7424|nr:hypothetical protein [Enterovibrio norvegicus]